MREYRLCHGHLKDAFTVCLICVLLLTIKANAMCADSLTRQYLKGFKQSFYLVDHTLYYDGRRVDSPYYRDEQGNLFNANGFEVVSIDNKIIFGGLEWRVGYERHSPLYHYPDKGLTIRRGDGFAHSGVGYDSYLYIGGDKCTEAGPGFYLHNGNLFSPDGGKIQSVRYLKNGKCSYVVKRPFFERFF